MQLPNILSALYKGHQLVNSAKVKKTGIGLALIVPLVSVAAQFASANGWTDPVPEEVIMQISETALMIVSPVLGYIIAATTGKIGLKGREAPNQDESDVEQ
ncbi:MAG: hypothetical protein HC888_06895 [Candidatus Competibacteraceae bacterium]|nr:hypothetical protein [Candidatus Competibacteraceae bacterium]